MHTLRSVARGAIALVVLAAALAATADDTVEGLETQIEEVEARLEEQSMAVGDLRENLERRLGFDELRSWPATLEPSVFEAPEVSGAAERYRGTFEPRADRPHTLEQVEKEIRYAEDNLPGARNQDRKQGFEKRLETWQKIREAILVELDEIAQTRYGMGYAALEKMARELDPEQARSA